MRKVHRNVMHVATAVLASLGTITSGGLIIDVRATGATGGAVVLTPKQIDVGGASAGATVSFEIYALVTGDDGDTTNDGILSFAGSYLSTNDPLGGSIRGNLKAFRDPAMRGTGGSNGFIADLDGDGDLDIGSNNNASAGSFFSARSSAAPDPVLGQQVLTATLTLTLTSVTNIAGAETAVNFRRRQSGTSGAWFEDGSQITSSDYSSGSPVLFDNLALAGNWTGATNASWDVGSNWSNGVEPSSVTDAFFSTPIPATGAVITLTNGENARSLIFNDNYTLTSGSVAISSGVIVVNTGNTATISSGVSSPTTLHKSGIGKLVKSGATAIAAPAVAVDAGELDLASGSVNTASLTVAATAGTTGTVTLDGGTLSTGTTEIGKSGIGSFVQNGGTHVVAQLLTLGGASGGAGTYRLNAGTVITDTETYGQVGAGTFIQAGGTHQTANLSLVATRGSYEMSSGTLTATALNLDSGTFTQTGGAVSAGNVNGSLSGARLTVNGGSFTANYLRLGSLTIGAAGIVNVRPSGTSAATSKVGTLVAAGSLDLADNDLIATNTSKSYFSQQIALARHAGAWDGLGITSSTAKSQTSHATSLGVLSGAEYISVYGPSPSFDGFTVLSTDTLVKYTWYGDTDFSGHVNFDDYVRIDAGYNNTLAGWLNGDFDNTGHVNFDDYVLIDLAFNTQNGTLRRAMSYLGGEDGSAHGMDDPALRMVATHLTQFGVDYAAHFLAAVPEPIGTLVFAGLPLMLARRRA